MLACRDSGKCSNLNCVLPESFEGYKVIRFAGVAATEDSGLILFGEESRVVENTDTDVDPVLVCDGLAEEACESNALEESQGEYLRPH
jgi:hypothetical protein